MTLQLRDYQIDAIAELHAHINENPILVLPTGAGKTFTAAEFVKQHNVPTLWLAHRRELVEQAEAELRDLGVNTGIIMAGSDRSPVFTGPPFGPPVWVASKDTLRGRKIPPVRLVVIDECHRSISETYRDILEVTGCPTVGLTATPFRLDGRGLGDIYGHIIEGPRTADLVDNETLHAPKVFAENLPDLKGVRKIGGDFSQGKELAGRMGKLTGNIIDTWLEKAQGRRTLVYSVNVEHSKAIVAAAVEKGIPAAHLDGKTPPVERKDILKRLGSGDLLMVSNCAVWTEGVDIPEVECAVIARPTASLALHLQIIGRIMRQAPDKENCLVLDHAGNHHRHGLVTRHIEYSLDGKIAGESDKLGLKRCPECFLLVAMSTTICPNCGHDSMVAREGQEVGVDNKGYLVEYTEDFEYKESIWDLLVCQAEDSGYKPGFAKFRYKERFGVWPVVTNGDLVDIQNVTQEQKESVYKDLLIISVEKKFKPGWASYPYKRIFKVWPKGFVARVKREVLGV